jgi:hypothetical protein
MGCSRQAGEETCKWRARYPFFARY